MCLQQPACVSVLLGILVQFTISKTGNELILKGHDTYVYVGFTKNITCTWTGAEYLQLLDWYRGDIGSVGFGIYVSNNITLLKIEKVRNISCNGKPFYCEAITFSGRIVKKPFNLMVKEIEYNFSITEDKSKVFNCLTLTCTVWCEVPVNSGVVV